MDDRRAAEISLQFRPPIDVAEAPSGKDANYENFPVGSWLLAAEVRPHVAVFYAYARAIDDIADSADLAPDDKVFRLDGFARAIEGEEASPAFAKGHAMRRSLQESGITPAHCLDLITAFKQDAVKTRYASWAELIDYCNFSAAPVGRYLLDLHGGSRHGYGPSDALCNALQILNHLQDCQDDYRQLNRVYLPLDWMDEAGAVVEDLDRRRASRPMRKVIDRCLDGIDALLPEANRLPAGLIDRRLALEAAGIVQIARRLSRRLRRGDPLARRIALSKVEYALCCARGALKAVV